MDAIDGPCGCGQARRMPPRDVRRGIVARSRVWRGRSGASAGATGAARAGTMPPQPAWQPPPHRHSAGAEAYAAATRPQGRHVGHPIPFVAPLDGAALILRAAREYHVQCLGGIDVTCLERMTSDSDMAGVPLGGFTCAHMSRKPAGRLPALLPSHHSDAAPPETCGRKRIQFSRTASGAGMREGPRQRWPTNT